VAVNTTSDILWIATARHGHIQLTVAKHWLVEKHSHPLECLTLCLVGWTWQKLHVLETAGSVNGRPATVSDNGIRGMNSTLPVAGIFTGRCLSSDVCGVPSL